MNYTIEIANKRNHKKERTSLNLITGFGMLGLGAFSYLMGNTDWTIALFHKSIVPSTVLTILGIGYGTALLYGSFFKNQLLRNFSALRLVHFATTLLFCLLFLASQWWLAAGISALLSLANMFAFFEEKKQAKTLFVNINDIQIVLPIGSKRKALEWSEVERVIIRHGNITIDTVDNFLFQYPLSKNETDAAEIETFCAAQVLANIGKRPKNDW